MRFKQQSYDSQSENDHLLDCSEVLTVKFDVSNNQDSISHPSEDDDAILVNDMKS